MSFTCTDSSSEDDEDDSVLKRAGRLLTGKADYLPSGILDITRIKDANIDKPSNVSHNKQLFTKVEVNSDGYLPSCEAAR